MAFYESWGVWKRNREGKSWRIAKAVFPISSFGFPGAARNDSHSDIDMDSNAQRPFGLIDLLAWFETNKKRAILWASVPIVVALITAGVVQHQASKEDDASEALSDVP